MIPQLFCVVKKLKWVAFCHKKEFCFRLLRIQIKRFDVSMIVLLGSFRSEYEYEIEYEYNFSNLVRILEMIVSHTNLVPRTSFSADQQQGEVTVLGT